MQAIEDDKKAYISFNSKAEAFKTYSAFKAAFPEKRGLYISSDNAGDLQVKAFLKNVNLEVLNYDYVICTPSISTGVSIDVIHFDFVGGIFKASINTANDCMQALGRVRTASERHVFCELRHNNLSLDPDTIKARWCETHQYDLALMNLDNNQARVIINADYEALCLSVTLAHNRSLNNFAENFMILALADGAEIVHADINVTKTVAKDFRSLKKALVQSEADNIGDAAITKSCEELRNLMNKSRKTMDESRSISKKNIIDFYNLNVHDKDSITALASIDNEGRFKKAILNLELALGDEQYARNKFLSQTKNSEQFAADVRHYASIQELYKFALDTVSLNSNLDKNNYNYSADNLINNGFVAYIEERRDVLKGLINLPSVSQLLADPVRFLGTLLGSMGIKQHRTGRSEKGMYQINNERLDLLKSLLAKRRLGSMATGTILDVSSITVKKSTTMDMIVEYIDGIKSLFSPKTQIFSDFCTP